MDLKQVYSYQNQYVPDAKELLDQIYTKTIKPHQIEVQPGPKSRSLCWLKCPYCYGGSSKVTGESLNDERYVEVLEEIAAGGVNKYIFAGYATDPLNYKFIEDLVQVPFSKGLTSGFHTKAIKMSDRLIDQLTSKQLSDKSYFSVSVDAGTNEVYNKVHGMSEFGPKFYDKVKSNLERLQKKRKESNCNLTLSATYLINSLNFNIEEVEKFITDFKEIGVDLIRFSFPQVPRGYDQKEEDTNIPNINEKSKMVDKIFEYIEKSSTAECMVLARDYDADMDIENVMRTLPCFARWIFPSIGYDGYLGHCSESAAPHFREMTLGNLNTNNFWDLYYGYDPEKLFKQINASGKLMKSLDCRCDRKEHAVNSLMTGGLNKKD